MEMNKRQVQTRLRLQAAEYDCVPTTFLNALCYLFEPKELPPLVVQRVFLYCLDSISCGQSLGQGTSGLAIQLLGKWLGEFKEGKFHVKSTYLKGKDVHLQENNPIARTLNAGGVALIRVRTPGKSWHFVLGLKVDADWLYAFDPYPWRSPKTTDDYQFTVPTEDRPENLKIRRTWLEIQSNQKPYRFGSIVEREVLLLERVSP